MPMPDWPGDWTGLGALLPVRLSSWCCRRRGRAGIAHAAFQRAQEDLASHVGTQESVSAFQANDYATEYALALNRTNFLSQWTDFVSLVGHDPAMNNLPARYVRPVQ